jgi:alkylation response protein AidB-like acyl-CoA dehydrogenase
MSAAEGMDLELTARQAAFRDEAREWLARNVPAQPLASMDTAEGFEQHRSWERQLHAGRWSVVSWPEEFGGRGASLVEWLLFEEEYHRSGAPGRVGQNGIFLLAPTIMEVGTDEQRARFLPPMAAADEIWCQGWSEPDAGSDLAGIRSRAVLESGEWVLEGQKTWCSRGAFADWMFGIFRTDPEAERHHGLTFFLVPLKGIEGVTVRPIPQLDGETGFAEVFFDGARVPAGNVLGEVGRGWPVAMATARFERGLSLRSPGRFSETARRLVRLYRERRAEAGDAARLEVARAWMDSEAYRLHTYWTVSKLEGGGTIGPEASLNKLFWSEMDISMHAAALGLLGPSAELAGGVPGLDDTGRWLDGFLFALAGPIYAGTNEIQRNVVAEQVLGLPRSR